MRRRQRQRRRKGEGRRRSRAKPYGRRRLTIFQRDRWRCRYCGLDASGTTLDVRMACLTLDHVVPLSRGGENAPWNLTAACERCNKEKAHRTPEEWRAGVPLRFCHGPPLSQADITRIVGDAREAPAR